MNIDPILTSVYARTFRSITDEMSTSMQRATQSRGQHRYSVFHAFSVTHNDSSVLKIDVLDSESQTFQ